MSWLSGFWATCRPRRSASARTSAFGESPSGNSECASCSWVEHPEHVGLVLAQVDGAVHLDQPVLAGVEPGVVAGRDGVEAERQGPVEHGGELDLLVAAQAGVRRASRGVLRQEVLDDVLVEAVAQVPDVERDPDHVGRAAGVVGVLDRAAAPRPGPVGLRVAGQGEVDPGDVVARVGGPGSGHRGVHAAAHRSEYAHGQPAFFEVPKPAATPAARARSTTGAIAPDQRVDVGLGAGVAQREAQRAAGLLGVAAHRQQDVGRPGEPRPSRPSPSSRRCRARRAASAASRPRSRGTSGARCRAAGGRARCPGRR